MEKDPNKKPDAEITKRWREALTEAIKQYHSLLNESGDAAKNGKGTPSSHFTSKAGGIRHSYGNQISLLIFL